MLCNPSLMRPQTVAGSMLQYVDTDTDLGDHTLLPGFKKTLEAYYRRATPRDKAKCLELLTSLKLGKKIRKDAATINLRPKSAAMSATKSAMAATKIQAPVMAPHTYLSTYKREHGPQERRKPHLEPGDPVYSILCQINKTISNVIQLNTQDRLQKLATEKAERQPVMSPTGPTHYDDEFYHKDQRPASPIRTGSSSGYRNNNPHPQQKFMYWRYPRHDDGLVEKEFISPFLTDYKIREINKQNIESTYQRDFIGAPQGFQIQSAYLPEDLDWKKQPYGTDTSQRSTYTHPVQDPILQVPTTRYGANQRKNQPAFGVAPVANKHAMDLFNRTTYDKVYNDTADAVQHRIRDIAHNLSRNTLQQYYTSANSQDKVMLAKMLQQYHTTGAPEPVVRPPSSHPSTSRPPSCRPPTRPPSYRPPSTASSTGKCPPSNAGVMDRPDSVSGSCDD